MIKISDYIAQKFVDKNISNIFLVTGGAAMHLNDSLGSHPKLNYTSFHHEQAASMAAESYYRMTGKLGVLNVTAGPGAINALNGVFGAYTDSMGMIVISGQAKRETMMSSYNLPLRQLGDQEVDIISMVKNITKYSTVLDDISKLDEVIEKAIFIAQEGRPGPVWIDVPVDIQGTKINIEDIEKYSIDVEKIMLDKDVNKNTIFSMDKDINKNNDLKSSQVLEKITNAKRPVIFAGTGIHISKSRQLFLDLIKKLNIPVVTAWTHDLLDSDHPLFCGRPGTIGTRPGNFVVQNADLLLVLGSRLNIRQTSYNWKSFASKAFKIQVDIDKAEIEKPLVHIDFKIHADLYPFLTDLNNKATNFKNSEDHLNWLDWSKKRTSLYPVVQNRHKVKSKKINPYHFIQTLFSELDKNDIIVCADATATIVPFQAGKIKAGQRMFSNSGCASMGYDLPAAIGAAIAQPSARIICLAGDGSIQQNIQELQTIIANDLNIKIIELNNDGYLSIKQTQNNFFQRAVGASPDSNLCFPNMIEIAKAYGFSAVKIQEKPFEHDIRNFLKKPGPAFCEVVFDQDQEFEPRLKSKQMKDGTIVTPSLEDMYPFLSREELKENIINDK